MFSAIHRWASFVKFSHTIFALPFALAAMAVAARDQRGWPGWRVFGLVLLAMVGARTCAMAFNRIVDRDFDRLNPRTHTRHLPSGQISLPSSVLLCILSAAIFLAAAAMLNPMCLYLSPVVLIVLCFYSLTKRFTDFTHIFLGLALGLAPLGGWVAVTGNLDLWPAQCAQGHLPLQHSFFLPLLLSGAVVFWLAGFDIIYALQDYEFDKRHGLGSLVVRWGPANALGAAFLSHMLCWGLLAVFGLLSRFRVPYFVGLVVILVSLVLEHWLARRRSLKWINVAFFRLNALISLVFLLVTVAEIVFPGFRR